MEQQRLLHKANKAYTLIELIVVVVILGLLAVSIPRYFKTEEYELEMFFQQTLGSIKFAQKIAIGMGCHVQVSATETTVTLKTKENCTTGDFTKDIIDPDTKQVGYEKTAPSDVVIISTNFPIYFDRAGKAHINTGDVGDAEMQIDSKVIKIIGETGYSYEE